ncbi:ornithine cyclodeaminase family protein [Dehalococcoidia bacterium]|nr:ornithine cyclodeaminase family protein [Dehalococcoidia bacterium]
MGEIFKVQYESSEHVKQTCPEIARGKEILYITRGDIENIGYTENEIRELVRVALTEHGKKACEMPAKIGIHPLRNVLHHAMPAFVPAVGASGIKWGASFPENYKYDLASTSVLIILNDVQTGWPIAVMDGIWITAKRTAAVSALAVEKLARRGSSEVGILGCGVQGLEHVMALAAVMPDLKKIKVMDIRPQVAQQLIDDFKGRYGFELVETSSIKELVENSDVVVTATVILQEPNPLIEDEWIKDGALLLPVDFDSVFFWKTMKRADKFLVDSLDEMNYFMSIGYLEHGLPEVYAELGEVIAGLKPGRDNDEELVFDMNIGMGVEDVVVARDILEKAIKGNIGTKLPL